MKNYRGIYGNDVILDEICDTALPETWKLFLILD